MKEKELLGKIAALEKRITELEARPSVIYSTTAYIPPAILCPQPIYYSVPHYIPSPQPYSYFCNATVSIS